MATNKADSVPCGSGCAEKAIRMPATIADAAETFGFAGAVGEAQTMEEIFTRIWQNLIDRVSGPMHFRLLLQPATAVFFAVRDGLKDAREGCPAYFWTIVSDPVHRKELVRKGWKAVARVFVIAMIVDTVYQIIATGWFYPGEALIVAIILVIPPYLLIRGPVNRLAARRNERMRV